MNRVQRAQILLEQAGDLLKSVMDYHVDLDSAVLNEDLPEGELTDLGFLQRETADILNELRKECNARQEGIGAKLCLVIMNRFGLTGRRRQRRDS